MIGNRVLVTGAKGFTGSYVCRALQERGFEVFNLTQDGSLMGETVNLCHYERVLESVETIRPNRVIHLAAIAYVGHGNPADFYNVNVVGTYNLLRALKTVGSVTGKVILASSANIYGNKYRDIALSEDLLPSPVNDYAVSKMSMELMARLWENEFPLVITRPFNYTGVGQSTNFLIPKIVDAFRKKQEVLHLGNINVGRDFSDVRDIAGYYVQLMTNKFEGIINLCSGCKYMISDVIALCSHITGHDITVESLDCFKRDNEVNVIYGSTDRMRAVFEDRRMYGMRSTLSWMLDV